MASPAVPATASVANGKQDLSQTQNTPAALVNEYLGSQAISPSILNSVFNERALENELRESLQIDFPQQAPFVAKHLSSQEKYRICHQILGIQTNIESNPQKGLADLCYIGSSEAERDENTMALACPNGTIEVRSFDRGEIRDLEGHKAPICGMQIYGNRIVSLCMDGILKIWDKRTGKWVSAVVTGLKGALLQVISGRIYLRDAQNREVLRMYNLQGQRIEKTSPTEVFSGNIQNQEYVITREGSLLSKNSASAFVRCGQLNLRGGHVNYATQIEDTLIAVSCNNSPGVLAHTIHVLNPISKDSMSLQHISSAPVNAVVKKGNLLFVASVDNVIAVYNLYTGKCIDAYKIPANQMRGVVNNLKIVTCRTAQGRSVDKLCIQSTSAKFLEQRQHIQTQEALHQMRTCYWSLGQNKWQEGVEASLHQFGPMVFDQGLHGGTVEGGFMQSWHNTARYLTHHFHRVFSAEMYLDIHRHACAHFTQSSQGTHMLPENVGRFRSINNSCHWNLSPNMHPTREAIQELAELNNLIHRKFGVNLARFVTNNDGTETLLYETMPEETVRQIFQYFVDNFHEEINMATTPNEKLVAIARLFRNSEWLHPVWDGTGRCDTFMLNFLLTQQGFHPAILPNPYIANLVSLKDWVNYLGNGLAEWESRVIAQSQPQSPNSPTPMDALDLIDAQNAVEAPKVY